MDEMDRYFSPVKAAGFGCRSGILGANCSMLVIKHSSSLATPPRDIFASSMISSDRSREGAKQIAKFEAVILLAWLCEATRASSGSRCLKSSLQETLGRLWVSMLLAEETVSSVLELSPNFSSISS